MISNWWRQALAYKVKTFRRGTSVIRAHRFRPMLEALEGRWVPATITVTSNADGPNAEDGSVTLREAIQSINQGFSVNGDVAPTGDVYGKDDRIIFDLGKGNTTIMVASELPAIVKQVLIDGANLNTAAGKIELTTNGTVSSANGLTLTASSSGGDASGSIIRNLIINGFEGDGNATGHGILIDGVDNVRIESNFIGTNRNGTAADGNEGHGVVVRNGRNNTIGGFSTVTGGRLAGAGNVISGNGGHGVLIENFSRGSDGDNNVVQGNFIGTDVTGTVDLGNDGGVKVFESSGNAIGGSLTIANAISSFLGNLISGNTKDGVLIQGESADSNKVQGNIIGLAINGDTKLGNGRHGVYLYEGASGNTIGGKLPSEGNVISGNAEDGVLIKAFGVSQPEPKPTTGNVVQNNFIGTDSKGTKNRGNQGNGVTITNGVFSSTDGTGADFNTIGGALGQGNIIAFNKGTGVLVGVEPDDDVVNNSILANSIFANGKLGIDLGGDGPTKNDSADPDSGPNNLQNFPKLLSVKVDGDDLVIVYSIADFPTFGEFRIEFFASAAPDPSGFGEGQLFLGSENKSNTGIHEFRFVGGASLSFRFFTATATALFEGSPRSTSEFSEVVFIPLIPPVVTTPGGDPIVVRIVQGDPPPDVLPILEVVFQEITVSSLPPITPLRQPPLLAPLPVERFQPLVDAPGEIHGQILDDPHALGKPGPDTFPLHGQPVYIDFNRNGEYDDGEPITVTNGKGEYTFTGLTAGQYTVHLLLGRTQDVTFSPRQDNKIELRSGNMIVTNVNFGVRFRARRGPGGRSSLPGAADGLQLADQSVLPFAPEDGSLEALPLPLESPELPVAAEPVPLAEAGDSVLSDLLRWGTWLLGAAVVVPWRQLAARRRQ